MITIPTIKAIVPFPRKTGLFVSGFFSGSMMIPV
jgi:hypothetical protein